MNRFDTIILSSTLISSVVIFFIYCGLKFYSFFKHGQWIKGVSTCEVFEIVCFKNTSFEFIGNLEALVFVHTVFLIYFVLHLLIIKKS